MNEEQIKSFMEKVKLESKYRKFLKEDIIYELISIFHRDYKKRDYSQNIKNTLELALKFYKDYNEQYYNIIIEGIENGKIIISQDNKKSFVDTNNNITFIKLYDNDGDLFVLVHEFAHFIDKNSNPQIIPDEYWFLSETFSFYIEKKLENWLVNKNYEDLIHTRKNNRMYFENKMLEAIENELYYENLFRKKGIIEESDIDIKKIKSIMKYDVSSNVVNYLLQYPLANIISDYFINNNIIPDDSKFVENCLNIELYELLRTLSSNKLLKK